MNQDTGVVFGDPELILRHGITPALRANVLEAIKREVERVSRERNGDDSDGNTNRYTFSDQVGIRYSEHDYDPYDNEGSVISQLQH